jgi:hypothetical protein
MVEHATTFNRVLLDFLGRVTAQQTHHEAPPLATSA